MIGDKWTMLVVRDLANGPRRTLELLSGLLPISSRTLVGRLRDMEKDQLIERRDFGGNPPHVEYALTARGRLLLPFLDSLRELGERMGCNECEDRLRRVGFYCETCPLNDDVVEAQHLTEPQPEPFDEPQQPPRRKERDDSIVLL